MCPFLPRKSNNPHQVGWDRHRPFPMSFLWKLSTSLSFREAGESGWSLRLGGRVGRHPHFAKFVGKVQTDEEVLTWVSDTILRYIENGQPQERLTHFLER